jgi:hypothetical protein
MNNKDDVADEVSCSSEREYNNGHIIVWLQRNTLDAHAYGIPVSDAGRKSARATLCSRIKARL